MQIITRAEAKSQGLKRYFTGKECKHGHTTERLANSGQCFQCRTVSLASYRANNKEAIIKSKKRHYESVKGCPLLKEKARISAKLRYKGDPEKHKDRAKEWAKANPEKIRHSWASYYKKNKGDILIKAKSYANENKDKINERKKTYRERNKEQIIEYQKLYHKINRVDISRKAKEKRGSNPLPFFIRATVRRIETATGKGRINRSELELNYTQLDFIKHIESQFVGGMSWERRSEWHIDHIKPIKAFLDKGVVDVKIINALSNLQPLWAKDNLSKGAKYNECA